MDNDPYVIELKDEERVRRLLADTILNLWGTVNSLTRLRASKRPRYRVTIFGSARVRLERQDWWNQSMGHHLVAATATRKQVGLDDGSRQAAVSTMRWARSGKGQDALAAKARP